MPWVAIENLGWIPVDLLIWGWKLRLNPTNRDRFMGNLWFTMLNRGWAIFRQAHDSDQSSRWLGNVGKVGASISARPLAVLSSGIQQPRQGLWTNPRVRDVNGHSSCTNNALVESTGPYHLKMDLASICTWYLNIFHMISMSIWVKTINPDPLMFTFRKELLLMSGQMALSLQRWNPWNSVYFFLSGG